MTTATATIPAPAPTTKKPKTTKPTKVPTKAAKTKPTTREGLTPKHVAQELQVSPRKVRLAARKLFKGAHTLGQSWALTPDQVEQLRKAFAQPS